MLFAFSAIFTYSKHQSAFYRWSAVQKDTFYRKSNKVSNKLENQPFSILVFLFVFSIIAQVIIEMRALLLVEDWVISCYNHPARGDYNKTIEFMFAGIKYVLGPTQLIW